MLMIWLFRIGLRNMVRARQQSLLTGFLLFAAALILITASSMGQAVSDSLTRQTIELVTGHVQIRHEHATDNALRPEVGNIYVLPHDQDILDSVRSVTGVVGVSPRLRSGGILTSTNDQVETVLIGAKFESELSVAPQLSLLRGSYWESGGLVISEDTAINLEADIGDKIQYLLIDANGQPAAINLEVTGIVDTGSSGMYVDHIAYAGLDTVQSAMNTSGITEYRVLFAHDAELESVSSDLKEILPYGYRVSHYEVLGSDMLGIAVVNDMMFELLFIVLSIVAAVGVLNTMLMVTSKRKREIGVLNAIGPDKRQTVALFLTEALCSGLIFAGTGVLVGMGVILLTGQNGIYVGEAMTLVGAERLFLQLCPRLAVSVTLRLVAVSMIGCLYPAVAASRQDPATCMRP